MASSTVHVRDSKYIEGPRLAMTPESWTRFVSYASRTDRAERAAGDHSRTTLQKCHPFRELAALRPIGDPFHARYALRKG
ncbi:DUF397 domain-containing protein [Streptomyces sp. NPDC091412]|uniref:DUF397 domain-containing protein n=1 Tax=Streptomyces sp. NPDC091412 TaxID=3366002 RepID=UPI0037F5AD41